MENQSKKYPRTLHAPISLGTTSDDRFLPSGYLSSFAKKRLVLTEKLDGQNNCFNEFGVFARSHSAPSAHAWDKPLIERWVLMKNDLKDLAIFGENVYAIHSIAYQKLESFFYVFGVREKDYWLSWEEVKFYANLFDFPTVPEIPIISDLNTEKSASDENIILKNWLKLHLKMDWTDWVKTSGLLGGYDPKNHLPACEGLVLRNAEGFYTNNGDLAVQSNEMDNVLKLVRAKHVKTDVHWTKNWSPTKLINYHKYYWHSYEQSF